MKIQITKTRATLTEPEALTSGMVGKTISLEFSEEWQGLNIIAVFSNGSISKDVVNPQVEVIIPWEVLEKPNKPISVGFYGYNIVDGEKVLAIPTIFAELGKTRAGADPSGDPSAELSPTVAEQLQANVNSNTERIEALEEGGGGGGDLPFERIGAGLKIVGKELRVDTANVVEQDNTKPVTSAAVHTQLGNVEALLAAL